MNTLFLINEPEALQQQIADLWAIAERIRDARMADNWDDLDDAIDDLLNASCCEHGIPLNSPSACPGCNAELCSTCNGTREVDESLGGGPRSDRHAPCPDCTRSDSAQRR